MVHGLDPRIVYFIRTFFVSSFRGDKRVKVSINFSNRAATLAIPTALRTRTDDYRSRSGTQTTIR